VSRARFEVAVVGGGVVGLACAWHLARLGAGRIALLEQFALGHERGSSHGAGRITRSSYGDALHVGLMQTAHAEDWPRLERDSGLRLIHRCDGAFFGPAQGPFADYAAAVAAVGAEVEPLAVPEARRRFPAFAFPDAAGELHDRTGGVVAAADTVRALTRVAQVEGVFVHEHTAVHDWQAGPGAVTLVTDRGALEAGRVVFAAGGWLPRLVPSLARSLTVKRQSVGYWILADAAAMEPGRFPVWAYLGPGSNGLVYGLPRFGAPGIKAALHETAGAPDDPDAVAPPRAEALAEVERFLRAQLAIPLGPRVHAETCLYTSTPAEDFVIGPLSGEPRVVIASACSGHGFKFAPLVGRIVAGLVRDGRSDVPRFEAARARFAPGGV
jgi:sarcosine oxidase